MSTLNLNTATHALLKYGVPKSTATYILHNTWIVPDDYRDLFHTYFLNKMTKQEFYYAMNEGTMKISGKVYQIIYHKCSSGDLKKLPHNAELLLSCRVLQPEYSTIPTVLVAMTKEALEMLELKTATNTNKE